MTFSNSPYTLMMIALNGLFAAVLLVLPVVSGRLLINEPWPESCNTDVDSEPDSSHAAWFASRSCLRPARRMILWRWHLPSVFPLVVGDLRYEGRKQTLAGETSFRAGSCPLLY